MKVETTYGVYDVEALYTPDNRQDVYSCEMGCCIDCKKKCEFGVYHIVNTQGIEYEVVK